MILRYHALGWLVVMHVLALLVNDAQAQSGPRLNGASVTMGLMQLDAVAHVEDDPRRIVARVDFALRPDCAGDPATSRYASLPVVSTTAGPPHPQYPEYRVFSAAVPDPSGGAIGAWTLQMTAYDARGKELSRTASNLRRSFPVRFRQLAFVGLSTRSGKASPSLDTSSGPTTAKLLLDIDHDTAMTSVGVITSAHDNPTFGPSSPFGALEADRQKGSMPSLASRIEQTGPRSFTAHFTFPASSPAMSLGIDRVFMTDARCRTAETSAPTLLALAVTSRAPRAIPVNVHIDRSAFASHRLQIRLQLRGPIVRSAPASEIGGLPAPLVTVRVFSTATPPRLLLSASARPQRGSPLDEMPWDGESMATVPVPLGAALQGEIERGVQIEVDDGGAPLAPRAVLRLR